MTQEDKYLLIKDLSARLPYGVLVRYCNKKHTLYTNDFVLDERLLIEFRCSDCCVELKPYLRPMSSMTEEEKKIFLGLGGKSSRNAIHTFVPAGNIDEEYKVDAVVCSLHNYSRNIDWLNKNHFDYRGLIPKDLAIEITKDNNPY